MSQTAPLHSSLGDRARLRLKKKKKLCYSLYILFFISALAPNMEHVLAVANEEGFVRLYNTESQSFRKKCFKGKSRSTIFVLTFKKLYKSSSILLFEHILF